MSKTFSTVLTGAIVVFFTFALLAFVEDTHADTRGLSERDRGVTGLTTEPTPSTEATPPSGGITSQTTGSASTGGNTGGQVTTGDEHVEVFEINIGPTNSPPSPDEEDEVTPPVTEPPCGSDARSRTTCPTDNTRTR